MEILYVIPARGGSKGIPYKNIKLLAGKPLICYSIDIARALTSDNNICVSTDDEEIIKIVEDYGLKVPFLRPENLGSDTATTRDVLLHVIDFYRTQGKYYDVIVLLQPTSPLRRKEHVIEALQLYNNNIDMVVSVKQSHSAPIICSENESGYLSQVIKCGTRRQDYSSFYEYNGSIYIVNIQSILEKPFIELNKTIKYLMPDIYSIDIDNELDWKFAELIINIL